MSVSDVFTYDALVHAIAGTAGGAAAMSTFYPLDVIRTHMQVADSRSKLSTIETVKEIVYPKDENKESGIHVLYKGLGPVLIALACSNFIYFYTNQTFKVAVRNITGKKDISTAHNLIVASLAGCVNVLTTCPLWVVSTRLKTQIKKGGNVERPYKGMVDGLLRVGREEGVAELWSGTAASLILVSNPTIQWVTYDAVRKIAMRRVNRHGRTSLNSLEIFILGIIAKFVATIITYPLQVAQSLFRSGKHRKAINPATQTSAGGKSGPSSNEKPKENYTNTIDCLIKIFKKDGIAGWYKGLDVKLVQTLLMSAFHTMTYEKIAALIFKVLLPS